MEKRKVLIDFVRWHEKEYMSPDYSPTEEDVDDYLKSINTDLKELIIYYWLENNFNQLTKLNFWLKSLKLVAFKNTRK